MKFTFIFFGLGLCLAFSAFAQDRVSGTIYNDQNGNSQMDENELALEGVAVSNGRDVVLTDKNGKYQLPIGDDNIVFVVKPSGYTFRRNSDNLHQFYYIHKPKGSPVDMKYAGSNPTGGIPKSVDFGLLKQDESDQFDVLVFGDPQTYDERDMTFFQKGIIDEVGDTERFSFGLSLGDLVGDNLNLHPLYKSTISTLKLPWFNVMGNHDMNYDATVDSLSDETFEKNFGPANYAFNYGNAHFIVLDNIIYPNPATGKGYVGGFREEQLQFLKNDLKLVPKEKLVVVAYHIPMLLNDRNSEHFRSKDRQRFMDILSEFPNTLSLSAHTHFQTQIFFDQADGWKREKPHHEYNVGTTSGDWYSGELNDEGVPISTMRDGTPKGYMFLHIDGHDYQFDYKVAGKDIDYQIALTGAEIVSEEFVRSQALYANFFIGSERDKVQYRLNDGEWKDMIYTREIDPDYAFHTLGYDQMVANIKSGKRPSNAENSTHLWKVRYPKMPVGEHRLDVRAVDMFGKEHQASKVVRVVK
ncbi:calcineurin-like phosphoesterase C-terminal domain-containing protein [Sphingobacterium corticis]|uniref:Calcineurin-like phosphoesterase C-terminal domain-containing protein n=1 Tax=Sphingobacterium corticis TaxID=1812823 RepID=A0ABW5NIR8_9SPHI